MWTKNKAKPADGSSSSTDDSSNFLSPKRPEHASWGSATTVSSDAATAKPSLRPANGDRPLPELRKEGSFKPSLSLAYPAMEITRLDNSKAQAMEAMRHIERSKPRLTTGEVPQIAMGAQAQESSTILNYIQDLEKKITELQANRPGTAVPAVKTNLQEEVEDDNRSTEAVGSPDHIEERRSLSRSPIPQRFNPWINEIKRYKKLNYRFGSAELYDDSEKIEAIRARESAARGGGYVIKLYREYDWEGNALNSKLEICSTPLLELLRSLIDYYPGPEFDLLRWEDTVGDTVTFSEPYMMLFTHRAELNQSLDTDLPAETKSHVSLLLQFLREEMPRASAKLDEIEAGTAQKISFQDLWLLYTPNTPVYSFQEDRQMVVYSRNNPEKNLKGQFGVLSLYCWSSIYKSNRLVREFYPWVIQPYTGEKPINQVELIPTQYLQEKKTIGERLIARGNQYFELNKKAVLQDYTGKRFPRVFQDEPIRVVVDQHTYWRTVGVETRTEDPSEEYGFPAGEESLENENGNPLERALVCCYPRVGVYSLRDREWALVDVDDLQPVQFREKAFKRLVIKDEYKKLITAMVQAHMLEQPGFSDIVAGKGRGLIVLLHGPPGTGKTLTAECVAEKQKRPLYTVSCGEIGTEPETVEKRLNEVFEYAVAWGAILLMDESDIFLQERDIHNVKRNALVSIFLRELEYFDGILFLTTNRPGDIDEAFHSRIHVSIGLKALDAAERRKVWAVFIKELDNSDEEKRALLLHVTEEYDKDKLNGRQIRNSVRTALAIAQLKKERLTADHLDRVVKIGREYTGYMEDLNKMNAEEYAIALGRRAPNR